MGEREELSEELARRREYDEARAIQRRLEAGKPAADDLDDDSLDIIEAVTLYEEGDDSMLNELIANDPELAERIRGYFEDPDDDDGEGGSRVREPLRPLPDPDSAAAPFEPEPTPQEEPDDFVPPLALVQ